MCLKFLPVVLLSAVATLTACKPKEEAAPAPAAATEEDKTLYALGVLVSQNLQAFDLNEKEVDQVARGLSDSLKKKTLEVEAEKFQEKVQALHMARMEAAGKRAVEEGKAFLEKAAAEPGAVKTESGIIITELKAGTGPTPTATDKVKVHYHGTLPDGKVFDSSVKRGEPIVFPLNGVIPCWTEGVQKIKVGGKSRLVCPSNLAYGERGAGADIKPGATLVFEVELLGIEK